MADVDRTDAARHVLRAGSRGDWIPRSTEGTRADDGETAIRRDLMDHFLHDAKLRLIVNKASMLTLVAICWNHADRTLLLGWLTLGLVHFTAMLVLETPYYRRKTPDTSEAQQRMLRTLAPLYVAGGLLWGMPPLFYFMMNSMPRTLETACGMIVVSMAMRIAAVRM